jgi:hypothetical protein
MFSSHPAKVLSAIKKLKSGTASGPDQLPPTFYKKLQMSLCVPLCDIFSQLLNSAVVPDEWRTAFVTPVFKKGISSDANNYRPISLTCVGCKLMESIINREIWPFY